MSCRCGAASKPASKSSRGRLYFMQFPVSLTSAMVCTLLTRKRTLGPVEARDAQR